MIGISTIKLASDFRETHRLGEFSPLNLISLLYELNITLVYKRLSVGLSGVSIKSDDGCRFIMVNSSHPLSRQNFTICHELYHLYFQEGFTSMICSTESFDESDELEYTADCFAADLLLPEFGIIKFVPPEEYRLNQISISTLLKIELHFSCSRTALLFRLKKMRLIDSKFYDTNSKGVKKSALSHGYSTKLYERTNQKLEVLGNYAELATNAYNNDKISESNYVNLMHDIGIDLDANIVEDVEQY